MKMIKPEKHFHKLYGVKKPRINYQKRDFLDYVLMTLLSALVICVSYGPEHPLSIVGMVLCGCMLVAFLIRHGFEFSLPLILRRPQDILYMIVYKIQNITPVYVAALGLLLLENYLIYLTPDLPHHVELMYEIAIYAFFLHFLLITVYRTVSLIDHLRKKELVREVVMESPFWSRSISKSITLEIVHAYLTGLLTHIVFIAPWYLVITYFKFSILFLPVVCAANIFLSLKFMKVINAWFYREHWLGHNAELEFLYLHGTHHDAIPSGMIGVAGNGHLEGYLQNILVFPNPFYNPLIACLTYTVVIKEDIDKHQFIPGIFPALSRDYQRVSQHSIHHFGRLEPYGFGIKLDQPVVAEKVLREFKRLPDEYSNSIRLDEELTGFEWNNPRYKWYLELVEKYQRRAEAGGR